LWHGLGLFVKHRWSDWGGSRNSNPGHNVHQQTVIQIGGILLTFHFVALGWVLFALRDPSLSLLVFQKLFGG